MRGVRSILAKAGLDEADLACGPHLPFHEPDAHRLIASGEPARPIHNNCSGKHAGMMALARHHGWSVRGYHEPGHPVQRRMLREVSRWSEIAEDRIVTGVDGCGVVCFALTLRELAAAFARFGESAHGDGTPEAILSAMAEHPEMVGGTGRMDTALMSAAGEAVVSKTGAEGVYVAVLRGRGLGVALKVEDGAKRASDVALLHVLEQEGVLSAKAREALAERVRPVVRNTRDESVGEIRALFQPGSAAEGADEAG